MTPNPPAGRPLHDRLLDYLDSPDGRKLLKGLAAFALFMLAQRRVVAIATAALSVGVVGASLVNTTGPSSSSGSIKQAWISNAGAYKIERVHVPCPGAPVDLGRPAAGVGHTTEGSWAGAISVFRRHYAPHFMVGRDNGRVRIVQFCPLGQISAALRNAAGGVETNRWARAQIELVGYSKRTTWQPDPGVSKAFAALLLKLRDSAGIPLRKAGDGSRSALRWGKRAGWFNHSEIPENSHWDMGAFSWAAALAAAAKQAPVVNPGHEPSPRPIPASRNRYRVCYWKRGLPKAVCIDAPYASLRPLQAPAPKPATRTISGGISFGTQPR